MKTHTHTITTYDFDELSDSAKENAVKLLKIKFEIPNDQLAINLIDTMRGNWEFTENGKLYS